MNRGVRVAQQYDSREAAQAIRETLQKPSGSLTEQAWLSLNNLNACCGA